MSTTASPSPSYRPVGLARPGQEFFTPANAHPDDSMSCAALLRERVEKHPDDVVYEIKDDSGTFRPVTARDFGADVSAVGKGFIASGVEVGDRVGIMSNNRYEWALLDFALWAIAAVPVPVYPTSSTDQADYELSDSGARLVVCETDEMAETLAPLSERVTVRSMESGAIEQLRIQGADIADAEVERRYATLSLESLATIVYTSGTTGRPKGAELTHRSFVEHALNGADDPGFAQICTGNDKRTLLFLPLSHVFGRYIEVVCMYSRSVVAFVPSPKALVADMKTFRPTWILGVPRVFEIMYNTADASVTGIKKRLFRYSAVTSIQYSKVLDAEKTPGPLLRLRHAVADKLVLHNLRDVMGGQCEWAICGGAPLSTRLIHFYRGLGLQVMEGYGLTETAAPTTFNLPGRTKVSTVGPAFPGTGLRMSAEGEVQVKGPNVFRGYRGNPEATKETFTDDGWLRTGDIGQLDAEGYLTITGRMKEIIVTAGGKNVQPALLADSLASHPLIGATVVVGDNRPFIGALIALDPDMLPSWLENHGLPSMSLEEAATNDRVRESLQTAIDRANRKMSRAESIRKFVVLPVPFTEDNGYMSAALKVKRKKVIDDFSATIDDLYDHDDRAASTQN